jgi:hypothetical protein
MVHAAAAWLAMVHCSCFVQFNGCTVMLMVQPLTPQAPLTRKVPPMTSHSPRLTHLALAAAALVGLWSPAFAQVANPLQPRATTTAPAATPAKPAAEKPAATADKPAATADKPKRERSEAQLANDNRLRKCGAEWRADKAALTAKGYNWIKFSTECRARLKAAGQ